jgi:hypothetical protein
MATEEVFLIGDVNVYDYKATTHVKRWDTLQATKDVIPCELRVRVVMQELGLDYMQARRHVRCQMHLANGLPRAAGSRY